MAAPTLHTATEIKAVGRLKDGDFWFKYGWNNSGVTTARDFYTRYKDSLLIVEFDENNGQGRRIASIDYLKNFSDLTFVQQSLPLLATQQQLEARGININGPLNAQPNSSEIPFEIVEATGKIAAKALPTDAGKELEKTTKIVENLAFGAAAQNGTTNTPAMSTRNVIGWVALGLLGVGIVALVVWGIGKMSKKTK
jgi:hypothetical protein